MVGTWKIPGGCENASAVSMQLASFCPGASISGITISASGTLTFNSDLTYSASAVTASVHATEIVPLSCTSAASCAAVTPSSTSSATVSCSGTTTCTCSVTNVAMGGVLSGTTSGTYSISGNSLTLQNTTGTNSNDYYVQGTETHFVSVDMTTNMGPMGQATIVADVVLNK